MIDFYFKTIKSKYIKKVQELRKGCWVRIGAAQKEDISWITKELTFDYEDLSDCLDQYEIPRLERINGNLLLFLRYPTVENQGLYTQLLTVVLNAPYFITISIGQSEILNQFIRQDSLLATTQQSKLLLSILQRLARSFTNSIKQVNDKVLAQKKELTKIDTADITFLIENEDVLNQYLSALVPMEEMIKRLLSAEYIKQYAEDKDLFEDVLLSISQSVNICKTNIRSIISLRDSYQILFSNKLNKTIQLLTFLTIILTIPTIIGSFFGMNVSLPLSEHPYAFPIILLITVIISLIFAIVLNKRKWF